MNRHFVLGMVCRIAAVLVLGAVLLGFACSPAKAAAVPDEISRSLNDLQTAYNSKNPDQVIACFDGSVYRSYETVAKLMGVQSSVPDIHLPFLCSVFPVRFTEIGSDLPTVRLTPLDCREADGLTGVSVDVDLFYPDGTQDHARTTLLYQSAGEKALIAFLPEYEQSPASEAASPSPVPAADDPSPDTAPTPEILLPSETEAPAENDADRDGDSFDAEADSPDGDDAGGSAGSPDDIPLWPEEGDDSDASGGSAGDVTLRPEEGDNSAFESYLASTVIDNVNIRKEPDKRSDLVSRLELTGTPVTVIGEATDDDGLRWLHVELRNGKRGFVRDNLIGEYDPDFEAHQAEAEAAKAAGAEEAKEAEDGAGSAQAGPTLSPEQAQAAANGTQLGRTNIDKVNLRHKADKKGGRIMYITHRGTIVTILSQKKDSAGELWYKIRLEDKTEGYVLASTVDPVTAADAAPAPAGSFPFRAVTNVKKVNLRQRADTKARRVTYITNKGTEVTILEEVTGSDGKQWYKVRLEDKTEGYALSSCFDPKN